MSQRTVIGPSTSSKIKDTWIGGTLRDWFPHIFHMAKNKKALTKECLKECNGGKLWVWEWNGVPTNRVENEELEGLNRLLLQQKLSEQKRYLLKQIHSLRWNHQGSQKKLARLEDLAIPLCWRKLKGKGPIAVWQQPNNHTECNKRNSNFPKFCNKNDDPDDGWYKTMDACITLLPQVDHMQDVSGVFLKTSRKVWILFHLESGVLKLLSSGGYRNVMDRWVCSFTFKVSGLGHECCSS
ncbi:putative S-adenosyl-L-methionine-dependent methyltransferase [Helianthus annuus]|nr:putative S-adenosyl-L-methionine-dependent methyltransferase [Helianthus annuus]